MVATGATRPPANRPATAGVSDFRVGVDGATPQALAVYEAVASAGIHAPPQGPAWTRTWIGEIHPEVIVVTVSDGRQPVFALALELVRRGPLLIARFPGGTHANGNFAPVSAGWLMDDPQGLRGSLRKAIAAARPDIDVLVLERLVPEMDGHANPLLAFKSLASPNISLAVDLAGGFDALLDRSSGKRKRKKHRSQSRKFEAGGGFRRLQATTPGEVERILDAFFAMKSVRFQQAGIANVFADAKVQHFFRRLFTQALDVSPMPFTLHAMEVGGKLRAITGSSRLGDRLICEFGAIVEDELSHASPGDYLFFENIKEACDEGLAVYDFSVGDELYKRLWCDIETRHRDVLVPLSVKGRLFAGWLHGIARAKASIKNNPRFWKLFKTLRKRAAGKAQPGAAAED